MKVRNFDLRVMVKVTASGNSGLQYRSVMAPEFGPDVVKGCQCDVVANNPEYNGMLHEEKADASSAIPAKKSSSPRTASLGSSAPCP
jgi:hypothetical protein